MKKIAVTLKRSKIGCSKNQRLVLASLGLKKINQTVVHVASPPILGMVNKVSHLVEVTEVNNV